VKFLKSPNCLETPCATVQVSYEELTSRTTLLHAHTLSRTLTHTHTVPMHFSVTVPRYEFTHMVSILWRRIRICGKRAEEGVICIRMLQCVSACDATNAQRGVIFTNTWCSVLHCVAVCCSVVREIRSWRRIRNTRCSFCELVCRRSRCVVKIVFTIVGSERKAQPENTPAPFILEHLCTFSRFQMCVRTLLSHTYAFALRMNARAYVCLRACTCCMCFLVIFWFLCVYVSVCLCYPTKIVVV